MPSEAPRCPSHPATLPSSCVGSTENHEMNQAVQDFLSAQQVQAPVRLYSDWLYVGHVDEFLSFVPAHKKVRSLGGLPEGSHRPAPWAPKHWSALCLGGLAL